MLVLSWSVSIYISLHYNYKHKVSGMKAIECLLLPLNTFFFLEPFESFDLLYDKPWQRFGPYVMGNEVR